MFPSDFKCAATKRKVIGGMQLRSWWTVTSVPFWSEMGPPICSNFFADLGGGGAGWAWVLGKACPARLHGRPGTLGHMPSAAVGYGGRWPPSAPHFPLATSAVGTHSDSPGAAQPNRHGHGCPSAASPQSALGVHPEEVHSIQKHVGRELSLTIRKHVILWDMDAVHTLPQQNDFQ